ncbi:hypothetical protein, partial [Dysosmobacter sp.]|uniref:hypothetical protein n=1 Tax=Dysosmobacter sp. TaxID=2591382 RepID=UPI002D7F5366
KEVKLPCRGQKASAEFCRSRRQKKLKSDFCGDLSLAKITSQAASVRAQRVRRSGLQEFKKVLALF